jgi:hypothetical protein
LPTIFNKPPNSTAFEKYGNYPVNMFSGVPDISIPLYEIKSGEISVPIVLKYHAAGNKVGDLSSWVGLGWSLSAGGEISRNVKGLPYSYGSPGYLSGSILSASGNISITVQTTAEYSWHESKTRNSTWSRIFIIMLIPAGEVSFFWMEGIIINLH